MQKEPKRRQTSAAASAERYLLAHPETPAADLAKKFKIALTTVYRAPWWKNRTKGAQQ